MEPIVKGRVYKGRVSKNLTPDISALFESLDKLGRMPEGELLLEAASRLDSGRLDDQDLRLVVIKISEHVARCAAVGATLRGGKSALLLRILA
jgi:hypothetical protein